MTRKVKHTAKQITAKVDSATTNSGCGNAGLADRSGIENGEFEYPLCKVTTIDIKSIQIHHEDCHPKIPFDETKITDLHASIASNSPKPLPGVHGSLKK